MRLGNLESKRDWGHYRDYVVAMWKMLQQDAPEDFVITTGRCFTVREFLDIAFKHVKLDYRDYLEIDENLYRPSEVNIMQGDAGKAKRILGWSPQVTFEQLIEDMVEGDLRWYRRV